MTQTSLSWLCAIALLAVPIAACSDDSANGGTGGTGNASGTGGEGGGGDGGAAGSVGAVNPLDGIGELELVSDGFTFTEGPTWRTDDSTLLFSDIPANTIYVLTPPSDVAVFRGASDNANGLDSDLDGLLLAAEHGTRRLSRTLADGTIVDVASVYMGDPLNSPNDIAVRSDGTIYFTDPPYGINPNTEQVLEFNGVFRVAPNGDLTAEWEGATSTRPNGLVLSPDENTLYVADTTGDMAMAFDVASDGALSGERVFVDDLTGPDGMAIDANGNLFITDRRGVRVYDPDGNLWGTIELADNRVPANCAFGGDDARALYITARDALYRVTLANPGLY
ncbi:MAG: SMP-30/gluconolactonase/LRE family protein [Myxococcota bacterium]